jgi:hypothetical protein
MTLDQILTHFRGPLVVARLTGVTIQSVYDWQVKVPWLRQLQIELITKGQLKHNPDDVPESMRWVEKRLTRTRRK